MTDHARAIEAGARAAALVQGDDFDKIPRDKPHWIEERGQFNGRSRDINEPFQSCYLEMSEEVIKAAIASGALVPASAVAEMRERCAKVADKYTASIDNDWNRSIGKADDMSATAEDIADIIRQLDTAPAAASRTGDTTT